MQAPAPTRRRLVNAPFGWLLLAWIAILAVLGVTIGTTGSLVYREWTVEAAFFWRQDVPVLAAYIAIGAVLMLAPAAWFASVRTGDGGVSARVWVFALAAVCLVAGVAGVSLVFCNYAFSLDEFLANFDAQIFASGRLMAPVPEAWRDYTTAMQPMYMLPLPENVWASSYLPMNAALRALGLLAHAEWLVNPLLSAFSVVAVWRVGRRLWPDRPDLALIAAALLGTSAQLIVMSMTAYAMPAHLAFNLAWLWLFLRGGRLGHAGAIVIGFLATGLHQLIFHPIFAAPFILRLWFQRRWGLGLLYSFAYAAIVGFWVEYWPLASWISGVQQSATDGSTGGGMMAERISAAFDKVRWRGLGVMAECLTRFVAWQNPLTAPLALIGAVLCVRVKGALRPLAFGVLLTLVATFFGTPTQTHGWGYRYLHGLMGSICLLAAWGWARLADRLTPQQRTTATGGLALACAISLLVLVPYRSWEAWSFVHPFAAANAAIQSSKADVVVIDHESDDVLFDKGTLTRNDPFLVRGPKVMALVDMDGDMVRELCANHAVAIFDGHAARAYGLDIVPWREDPGLAPLRTIMARMNCGTPMVR
jgi:hypothetical protein